jgi:hypothetical protein
MPVTVLAAVTMMLTEPLFEVSCTLCAWRVTIVFVETEGAV